MYSNSKVLVGTTTDATLYAFASDVASQSLLWPDLVSRVRRRGKGERNVW